MIRAYLVYTILWGDDFKVGIIEFPNHGYAKAAGRALLQTLEGMSKLVGTTFHYTWTTTNNEKDET